MLVRWSASLKQVSRGERSRLRLYKSYAEEIPRSSRAVAFVHFTLHSGRAFLTRRLVTTSQIVLDIAGSAVSPSPGP